MVQGKEDRIQTYFDFSQNYDGMVSKYIEVKGKSVCKLELNRK